MYYHRSVPQIYSFSLTHRSPQEQAPLICIKTLRLSPPSSFHAKLTTPSTSRAMNINSRILFHSIRRANKPIGQYISHPSSIIQSRISKSSSQPASRLLPKLHLVGDTNDTASRTGTRVTGLLGLGVVALAEVVGSAVDDDGAL